MASTFIAIQTITTSTSPSSITFSSIPQTYKHLCIIENVSASTETEQKMFVNANTSAVYRYGEMNFSSTAAPAQYRNSGTTNSLGNTTLKTNVMSGVEIWIPNYVSTDLSKSYLYRATSIDNTGSNTGSYGFGQMDEVGAISSLTFTISSGTYNNDSNITLYGLA